MRWTDFNSTSFLTPKLTFDFCFIYINTSGEWLFVAVYTQTHISMYIYASFSITFSAWSMNIVPQIRQQWRRMDWVVWCIYINDTRYAYNLLYIFEYVEKVTMNIYEHLFKFAMSRFIFLNIKSRRIYPRLKVLSFVCEVLHLFFLVRMPHDACSYDVWMFVLFYVGWDENGVVFEQFQHLKWFVNHFKCHCNCMVFFFISRHL